jgi:hypothetical protein
MRARRVASTILNMAVTVVETGARRPTAAHAIDRVRWLVRASRKVRHGVRAQFEDEVAELWFPVVDDEQVRRANAAFFEQLARAHDELFLPSSAITALPPLPEDPRAFRALRFGPCRPIELYANRGAIEGKKVLELGTRAAEVGKFLARSAKGWLGLDDSTAALQLAKLVSPENAVFVHPSKHMTLATHHGSIETVVGRRNFVHRNLDAAKELLGFVEPFLIQGGRLYAEFYFPNPDHIREHVYPAAHPPSEVASALFAYSRENVEAMIKHRPFLIVHDEERPDLERRFVILEKTYADY